MEGGRSDKIIFEASMEKWSQDRPLFHPSIVAHNFTRTNEGWYDFYSSPFRRAIIHPSMPLVSWVTMMRLEVGRNHVRRTKCIFCEFIIQEIMFPRHFPHKMRIATASQFVNEGQIWIASDKTTHEKSPNRRTVPLGAMKGQPGNDLPSRLTDSWLRSRRRWRFSSSFFYEFRP